MNPACGGPPSSVVGAGGDWRKGWPLRFEGFAMLCDKCGAAAAGYHPAVASPRHHFAPAAAFGFHYWPEHAAPVPKAQAEEFPLVDAGAAAEGHYALLPQQQQQNHNGLVDDHQHNYAAAAAGGFYYAAAEDAFHNGGAGGAGGGLPPRAVARRANGLSSTRRPCHYFIKGMCKNGQNCHYSHHYSSHHHHQVYSAADGFADDGHHSGGGGGITPGALEKLELEIIELLNSRHGQPLSIASLPTLYGEREFSAPAIQSTPTHESHASNFGALGLTLLIGLGVARKASNQTRVNRELLYSKLKTMLGTIKPYSFVGV